MEITYVLTVYQKEITLALHKEIKRFFRRLWKASSEGTKSSGVYICNSIVNYLVHGNYISKSYENYLTYEHRIEIPVEFTYVNQ